jgi:hypothetical protein
MPAFDMTIKVKSIRRRAYDARDARTPSIQLPERANTV